MLRNLILVLAISLFCLGCPGGSSNGGSDEVEQHREFYIENHKIRAMFKPCWGLNKPADGGQVNDVIEAEVEEYKTILHSGQGYTLQVGYYNDQDNTRWIQFEVFVDGNRMSSAGRDFTINKHREDVAWITLFESLPYDYVDKEVTIDVWLEDVNGVASEVYTIEVEVERYIWFPPKPIAE